MEPTWEISVGINKQQTYYAINVEPIYLGLRLMLVVPDERILYIYPGNAVVEVRALKPGEYTAMVNKRKEAEAKQEKKQNEYKTVDWDTLK